MEWKLVTFWIYLNVEPRGFTYELVWDMKKKKEKNQGWFRVWDLSTRRKYTCGRSKRSFFTISGNFDFLEDLSHQLKENLVGKGNNLTRESSVQKKWGPFPTEQPVRGEQDICGRQRHLWTIFTCPRDNRPLSIEHPQIQDRVGDKKNGWHHIIICNGT